MSESSPPVPVSGGPVPADALADLAAASRILVTQGVVDGFGHVSMRLPRLISPAELIWNARVTMKERRIGFGSLRGWVCARFASPYITAVAHGVDLLAEAGNGGQEIRTWIAMSAALADTPARMPAYEDIPEWLTGMAVMVLDPARNGDANRF